MYIQMGEGKGEEEGEQIFQSSKPVIEPVLCSANSSAKGRRNFNQVLIIEPAQESEV